MASVLPNPSWLGSALSDLLAGGSNKREGPDYRQSFYLALAKVLGAAAWIDGPINHAEVNVVKSLLHELSPRLTTRELRRVQRYLVEPVPRAHWSELLVELSEFTGRRTRLQLALDRLHALLAADGEPSQVEMALFNQAQTLLGWRDLEHAPPPTVTGLDALDTEHPHHAAGGRVPGAGGDPAAGAASRPVSPATGDIRLGDLTAKPHTGASPTLVERVHEAALAGLAATGGSEPPPRKLAIVAATVAHITMRRAAGTEGEDAELVGFAAAVTGVGATVADRFLEAARGQPATPPELAELAGELQAYTSPLEIASLAKLLNSMANGEAALRRLRELTDLRG